MESNQKILDVSDKLGVVLQALGSPARIAILIAIGHGEACVCHLESILGWRQAYISQNLMALRKAEILEDRRDGRYVYYRLKDKGLFTLIREAARLSGLDPQSVDALFNPLPNPACECPHCSPEIVPVKSFQESYDAQGENS